MPNMAQWQIGLILFIASTCPVIVKSKVFERCELAKILHVYHHLDLAEVAQWVCIAQHSSGFNTAAQAGTLTGGSHGLFQISDVYWCSPPGQGAGCNLPCHKLRDEHLSDDLSCAKLIYNEHQRLSSDGYSAWKAYEQYCKQNSTSYIQNCSGGEQTVISHHSSVRGYNSVNTIQDNSLKKTGKVYKRCELARELYDKHKMPMQQIPTWICIAEHESRLNTAAVGRLNSDGSADHGLFQISDLYWCSHDRFSDGGGKACGLSCNKLLDNDITDDVQCIKRIFNEHTAISGDGFTAWTVYKPYCENEDYSKIAICFPTITQQQHKVESYGLEMASNQIQFTAKLDFNHKNPFLKKFADKIYHATPNGNDILKTPSSKGKMYTRCTLAQELYFKHEFPIQDISTWVCIAEHESRLHTAAVGHLNADGSSDHGLFQINDRYWCDHTEEGGRACNLPCNKLLDDDISDDVACIKTIYDEHTRLSGDGFNAWTVYKPHCQNQIIEHIKTCFDEKTLLSFETFEPSPSFNVDRTQEKGKIYTKCELAQELYHRHNMVLEQIPKWVCIAEHESSFNTAAVGRLNTDGSADHGLFQISDLFWCSHDQFGGKACNMPCKKLLDSDITDDIKCIKTIHEEHTRISGDGFNAWTVYQPHCRNTGMDHIKQCFTEQDFKNVAHTTETSDINSVTSLSSTGKKSAHKGKVYKKCDLAQELYHKHQMPMEQIPTWVCIAQHESFFNTAAVGRLNTDGSADHGLFQISDLYWCTHDQFGGKACNIPCKNLLDSDITDDVKCIKAIHEEHTRISGDGFNAWTVYQPHCRNTGMDHIKQCFTEQDFKNLDDQTPTSDINSVNTPSSIHRKSGHKGKVYKKCELAQELYRKHQMPMEQIPKWVCIAKHESSFNTAAVGRLNTDGSADHGLFQISDLYWCSHDRIGGKACNIPCDQLLDSDITDDVNCIKVIHEEHTRISGDGFNAWTVYKPHCRNTDMAHVKECFTTKELKREFASEIPSATDSTKPTIFTPTGKVYKKCELAQELWTKHKLPIEEVPTWVCIAQYESAFNTAAVGRLNGDGSLDHGLFQISDLYWCSHDNNGGKACNIPCHKLLDSDITDDIQCLKIIYDEHSRISGDGFNAWTVYKPHCRNRKIEDIKACFSPNQIKEVDTKQILLKSKDKNVLQIHQGISKVDYKHNPFLSGIKPSMAKEVNNYVNNPFLQSIKVSSESEKHEIIAATASTKVDNKNQKDYLHNPFLSGYIKPSVSSQNIEESGSFKTSTSDEKHQHFDYKTNPFLNGQFSSGAENKFTKQPEVIEINTFKNNPFLDNIKLLQNEKLMQSSKSGTENNKNYIDSNDFRTTTRTPTITFSTVKISSKDITIYSTTHKPTPYPKTTPFEPTSTSKITTMRTTTQKPTTNLIEQVLTFNTSVEKPTLTLTTTTTPIPKLNLSTKLWTTTQNPTTTKTYPKTGSFKTNTTFSTPATSRTTTSKKPTTTTSPKFVTTKTTISSSLTKDGIKKAQKTKIAWNVPTNTKKTTTTTTRQPKISTTTTNKQKNHFNQNYVGSNIATTHSVLKLNTTENKKTTAKPQTPTGKWRHKEITTTTKINDSHRETSVPNLPTATENMKRLYNTTFSYSNTTTTKPQISAERKSGVIKQNTSTTKPPTTTANWRKWDKTNVNNNKASTTKLQTSTENWKKWDKISTTTPNIIQQKSSTTKLPNTEGNWRTGTKTTTKKPKIIQEKPTTTKLPNTTENWRKWDKTTKWDETTTAKTHTSTENLKKWDKMTTEKPDIVQQQSSTTKLPHTKENWRKWDKKTNLNERTTAKLQTSTENWKKWDKTTTKKPNIIQEKPTTTKLPNTTTNWRKWDQTTKWDKTTTEKPHTSTENWKKWVKISTKQPDILQQKSSTTKLPSTEENWSERDTTAKRNETTTAKLTTRSEKWINVTTVRPVITDQISPTTKLPNTTENWRKWDKPTTNTHSSTENWRKWDRTSTKKPSTTTANIEISKQKLVTSKLQTSTEKSKKLEKIINKDQDTKSDRTTTKRSAIETTTTKTQISTRNWRKWDRNTAKQHNTTAKNVQQINSKSKNEQTQTTTKPQIASHTNGQNLNRTRNEKANTTTNYSTNTTTNGRNIKETTTRSSLTSTENLKKWNRTTATASNNKTLIDEMTTVKPSLITTSSWKSQKPSSSALPYKNESPTTTKPTPQSITNDSGNFDKYKKDPFSHPFFAKVQEKIRLLQTT